MDDKKLIPVYSSRANNSAGYLLKSTWTDILYHRTLLRYMIRSGINKTGANTVLGHLWWVIDPLLQMLVYVVLVGVIFQRGVEDYPLFLFGAILSWKWFGAGLSSATSSIIGQERIIRQIKFPKIIIPLSTLVSHAFHFAAGIVVLLILMLLFFTDRITLNLLWVPVIALVQFLFTMPVILVLAGANVFFRDISNLIKHVLRFWFYMSPGLYSLDHVEEVFADNPLVLTVYSLNPFVALFESYRDVVYRGIAPTMGPQLLLLTTLSIIGIFVSVVMFRRMEASFAKVL